MINQIITYDFRYEGTSDKFNKINYNLLPKGIYSGGVLSRTDSSSIQISKFVAFYIDSNNEIGSRIETNDPANLTVSESTPYIVLKFYYDPNGTRFGYFEATAYNDLESDSIIFGRCEYINSTLQSTFDLTRRDEPYISKIKDEYLKFKVVSTEPFSNKVLVKGGSITTMNKVLTINDTLSPAISNTILGRIDLVYIDSNGNILIDEGVDSSSPITNDYSGKFVIAEISRGASKSYVTQEDITNIKLANFDFSEITESANVNKGAYLVHVGDQDDLNEYDNVQEQLGHTARKLLNTITSEVSETVEKDDPVGINFNGNLVKAGIRTDYSDVFTADTFKMEMFESCITNNGEHFIIFYKDSTTNDLVIRGYTFDLDTEEFKIAGELIAQTSVTNSHIALSAYREDQFIAVWNDGGSDSGNIRIGEYIYSSDSDDSIAWVTSNTTMSSMSSQIIHNPSVTWFGNEDKFVICFANGTTNGTYTGWVNSMWYRIGYEDGGSIVWDISDKDHLFSFRLEDGGALDRREANWNYKSEMTCTHWGTSSNTFISLAHGARVDADNCILAVGEFDDGDPSADWILDPNGDGSDLYDTMLTGAYYLRVFPKPEGRLSGKLYLIGENDGVYIPYSALNAHSYELSDFSFGNFMGSDYTQGAIRGFTPDLLQPKKYLFGYNPSGSTSDNMLYATLGDNPDYNKGDSIYINLQSLASGSELISCLKYKNFIAVFYNDTYGTVGLYEIVPFIGVANENITSGNNGEIVIKGPYISNATLKKGRFYYLDLINKDIRLGGTKKVGFAINSNSLILV